MESSREAQPNTTYAYNHASHEPMRRFLRFLIRYIGFTLLVKQGPVDGMENVPSTGPAILMINHIAFIDPFLVINILPRNIIPLAKVEVYDYPLIGIFPRLWAVVPVRREEVDRRAIQEALSILRAGEIILVAPEGTRGNALQEGKVGVAYLASHSGAPVITVAITDTPGFPALRTSSRWKGPGGHVTFGRPFRYRKELSRPDREQLRLMTDEAMYILASLLPEGQRGYYGDLTKATQKTIEWAE